MFWTEGTVYAKVLGAGKGFSGSVRPAWLEPVGWREYKRWRMNMKMSTGATLCSATAPTLILAQEWWEAIGDLKAGNCCDHICLALAALKRRLWMDTRRIVRQPQAYKCPEEFLSTASLLPPNKLTRSHIPTLYLLRQTLLLLLLATRRRFSQGLSLQKSHGWPLFFRGLFLCCAIWHLSQKVANLRPEAVQVGFWKHQNHCKNQCKLTFRVHF